MPKGVPAEHYNIPAEWVQMMIDQRQGLKKRERLAIDAFLLSFALMGINAGDMYKTSEKARDGVIHYFRSKTTDKKEDRAEMYVRIEPCISQLMKEYAGKDRLFDFSERYTSKESFNCALNEGLKQWKERNGLKDERFTFYAARHTWATLGASKQVGVDFALITEGLCHSDASRKMDMVYIRKDWERVWDANAKVLSLLTWR
jgi:integrase